MKALITGASSGIGYDMALYLSKLGYDLIIVARNKEKLLILKENVNTNVTIFNYDLSLASNCYKLYEEVKDKKIDIVINNAGVGVYGDYGCNNIDKEMNMIDLNIKAVHILTKLFINNENTKYILNVASSAGLMNGGPLMSGYYASKGYVCDYSFALYEELRRNNSDKHISVLCPGPVDTDFNKKLDIRFDKKTLSTEYVSKYAIDKMFKNKFLIVPGFTNKLAVFFSRFIPRRLLLKIVYNIQKKKRYRLVN